MIKERRWRKLCESGDELQKKKSRQNDTKQNRQTENLTVK
jgi:hypothetical protein